MEVGHTGFKVSIVSTANGQVIRPLLVSRGVAGDGSRRGEASRRKFLSMPACCPGAEGFSACPDGPPAADGPGKLSAGKDIGRAAFLRRSGKAAGSPFTSGVGVRGGGGAARIILAKRDEPGPAARKLTPRPLFFSG